MSSPGSCFLHSTRRGFPFGKEKAASVGGLTDVHLFNLVPLLNSSGRGGKQLDASSLARPFSFSGYCPVCNQDTTFRSSGPWFRDYLNCETCEEGSVPRERSLALILKELRPGWRNLSIHESSPAIRGISLVMQRECRDYIATQYFPSHPLGEYVDGTRNENLECQTFEDAKFDIVVSLDVMEHVYQPDKVYQEIYRTLKPGGLYICTFPVRKHQVHGWKRRCVFNDDGTRTDIDPLEVHGNPIDSGGSIVTIDYGYDLHKTISEWSPFDVRVYRFADKRHGILGEYTDLIACFKR
ncbi:hypothetical protein D3C80_891770 [compost metagenome]